MAQYVTIAQAYQHLRLHFPLGVSPQDPEETDLQLKLDAAEAIVVNYLKTDRHLDSPDRALIIGAILIQCGELYAYRGDGEGPAQTAGDLSPVVTNILRRFRDPALA